MKREDIAKLAGAFAASALAAGASSLLAMPGISSWYALLNQPPFSPPGWLFIPAWAILYALTAIALFLVWRGPGGRQRNSAIALYAAQLIVNVLWSIAFFGLRSVPLGFALSLALFMLVLVTASDLHKISRPAAYVMVPSVLWAGFTALLTGAIYLLNP